MKGPEKQIDIRIGLCMRKSTRLTSPSSFSGKEPLFHEMITIYKRFHSKYAISVPGKKNQSREERFQDCNVKSKKNFYHSEQCYISFSLLVTINAGSARLILNKKALKLSLFSST